MSEGDPTQWIVVTTGARTLPAIELLTGRGFITGKSGSGKSNSASVIAEELLEARYNMLIVDTEGEYFGLKEQYELLHVGATPECDAQVTHDHAETIASIALNRNVPIILDVSGYMDQEEAQTLIQRVVDELFRLEGELRKPFLLIVEEIQEYLPQSGGKDELSELLLRVGKRGRKRGLGLCGISQRPSAVDKDFITQCDWMVWHRLTWRTDVDIVKEIFGAEVSDQISELDNGEGFLVTDWDDSVERVQFRQKKTFDAGATPGLQEYERPDLKAVGQELLQALEQEAPIEDVSSGGDDGESPTLIEESIGGKIEPDVSLNGIPMEGVVTDEPDVDSIDDPEELRKHVLDLRRRNQILEDEVRELKTIIRDTEQRQSQLPKKPTVDPPRHDGTPPRLFEEPKQGGASGMLVESGLLVSYLVYAITGRLRRGFHGIRGSGGHSHGSDQQMNPYPVKQRRSNGIGYVARAWFVIVLIAVFGALVALILL